MVAADDFQLLLTQVRRHETEDADAPCPAAGERRRLLEQPADLGRAHQRQGKERQCARLADRSGESGGVTDARHGALHDRKPRAVRARQRRVLCQRPRPAYGGDVRRHRIVNRGNDPGDAAEAAGERRGKRDVLPQWIHLASRRAPPHARADLLTPRRMALDVIYLD
jgi:hypothetical protein